MSTPSAPRVVIRVAHRGEPKMVGKVFVHHERALKPTGPRAIFLHEEVSGSQRHRAFDCPGGVDACVLTLLRTWGVRWVYHFSRPARTLHVTEVATIQRDGIRSRDGGRDRLYLPGAAWITLPARSFEAPYITAIHDLDPATGAGQMVQAVLL